jgi:hypothetical protein
MPTPTPSARKFPQSPKTRSAQATEPAPEKKTIGVTFARCNSCGDEFFGDNAESQALTHWITWHKIRRPPLVEGRMLYMPNVGVTHPFSLAPLVASLTRAYARMLHPL